MFPHTLGNKKAAPIGAAFMFGIKTKLIEQLQAV
jgi:hypothetical protein